MYCDRIRQWGISKNITKSQKAALEERLSSGDNLSGSENYRLRRAKKYAERKSQRQSGARGNREISESSPSAGEYRSNLVDRPSGEPLLLVGSTFGTSPASFASWGFPYPPMDPWSSEQTMPNEVGFGFTHLSLSSDDHTDEIRNIGMQFRGSYQNPTSLSPLPSLDTAPDALNMDRVFRCIRDYSKSYIQSQSLVSDNGSPTAMSGSVKQAWDDLNNCIYLFKIGNLKRAIPALDKFRGLQAGQVIEPTIHFIMAIFVTLSPINTPWGYPNLRIKLLAHLRAMAVTMLKDSHPLTEILKQMEKDENHSSISEQALVIFEDSFASNRTMSFQVRLQRAKITRRKGNTDDATRQLSKLETDCVQHFHRDTDILRSVRTERSHILVAKGKTDLAQGNFGQVQAGLVQALSLSLSVLGEFTDTNGTKGYKVNDDVAIHAMEDVAEIHALLGDMRKSMTMLEHAAEVAVGKWNGCVATTHILDKCADTLRKTGREADVETFKTKYKKYLTD